MESDALGTVGANPIMTAPSRHWISPGCSPVLAPRSNIVMTAMAWFAQAQSGRISIATSESRIRKRMRS
jgi:hypothetical protein